ncbi:family 43 glycosylhydrolase [Parabacteroides sp. OttesenSCG-928-B22]|nr:family 43 glycosylhydrolase [Parabacteroides sp. OttesenSCG-928-B22]
MKHPLFPIISLFLLFAFTSCQKQANAIHNGIPWFDDRGNIVNAHGACLVEDNGRYYLFGEYKSNGVNAFFGFSCYSSDDLVHWTFERVALGVQPDGLLGPQRIGERVKVMKCPTTGEYVMYMHCDDMKYTDPHIGYATSPTINGEYTFHGPLLHEGEPIRRWDMGTFQDTDGTGYLLIHHGIIYRLSDDYRSAAAIAAKDIKEAGESPTILKKGGIYYLLSSNLTSWERNDNKYHTATQMEGPWTLQGLFCPEGTLTHNSQCSFVLPVVRGNDTIHMYMGDRWSFPNQSDAATQVWIPMQAEGHTLSIPEYWEAWDFQSLQQVDPLIGGKKIDKKKYIFARKEDWSMNEKQVASNVKESYLEVSFKGRRFALVGESNSAGGYAKVYILDEKGATVHASLVDFYSKVSDQAVRFMSPQLPEGKYTARVEITGIIPEWFKKNGDRFGSSDCFVTISDVVFFD